MTTKMLIAGELVTLTGRTFEAQPPAFAEALNRWAAVTPDSPAKGTPEGQLRVAAEQEWGAVILSYTEPKGVTDEIEY